jgi:hypothetical protein
MNGPNITCGTLSIHPRKITFAFVDYWEVIVSEIERLAAIVDNRSRENCTSASAVVSMVREALLRLVA